MDEKTISTIIIIILAIIVGIFGEKLSNNRNTIKQYRDDNKRSRPDAEGAISEIDRIRKEQEITE